MDNERHLRKKYTLRAHGQQVVFVKQKHERKAHVWMKAFLWALYLPDYPDISVEVSIDDRYKPDLVSFGLHKSPRFWGEAGAVSREKIERLVRKYPRTHFAWSKWNTPLETLKQMVHAAVRDVNRFAPVDVVRFPADSYDRYVNERGEIQISRDDLEMARTGQFRKD